MGGPCLLLVEDTDASAEPRQPSRQGKVGFDIASLPRKTRRRIRGPPVTDNFQLAPFELDGAIWQSVEQCYQAYKFLDAAHREKIRLVVPSPGESDSSHGLRVWRAGNSGGPPLRSDWDAVKIEVMLRACRAKLSAHAHLRDQLLATGDVPIVGAPSTDWHSATGYHNWSEWNGKIQMLLREELRRAAAPTDAPVEDPAMEQLKQRFAEYMAAEGGARHALPADAARSDADLPAEPS